MLTSFYFDFLLRGITPKRETTRTRKNTGQLICYCEYMYEILKLYHAWFLRYSIRDERRTEERTDNPQAICTPSTSSSWGHKNSGSKLDTFFDLGQVKSSKRKEMDSVFCMQCLESWVQTPTAPRPQGYRKPLLLHFSPLLRCKIFLKDRTCATYMYHKIVMNFSIFAFGQV